MSEPQKQIYRNPLPCRSWKTTNQILMFTILLAILILGLTLIISQFFLEYSSKQLRQIAEQVSAKQTQDEVLISSYYQLRYTKIYFRSGIKILNSINDIYQYVQQNNMTIEPPTECLAPANNPLSLIPQFCFTRFVPELSNQSLEVNYSHLTSVLNSFAPEFDLTKLTYYGMKGEGQYSVAYNISMPSSYRPHVRPWYQEHLKTLQDLDGNNQTFRVSDPYITYKTKVIMVTETMSLLNLNGDFDGIVAQDSKFPHIPQSENSYIQPIIVNQEGKLLTTTINGISAQEINKIYTTNYTGFTEEDWILLKSLSQENKFNITRIFNQIKNEYVIISGTKLDSYYLFLFIDDKHFRNLINNIMKQIDEFYSTLYSSIILIGILLLLLKILLQIITIKFLFLRDLMKLSIIAEKQILKHSILFSKMKVQDTSSDIRELFFSYYKALNSLTNNERKEKNKKCYEIECIKYPIKSKQRQSIKYLKQIKQDLIEIQNKEYQNKKMERFNQQQILQLFIKCCQIFFRITPSYFTQVTLYQLNYN